MAPLLLSTMVWASAHWTLTVATCHPLVKTVLAENPLRRWTHNSVCTNVYATLILHNNIAYRSWRGCSCNSKRHCRRAVCRGLPTWTASTSRQCTKGMTNMLINTATRPPRLLYTQSCLRQNHLKKVRTTSLYTKSALSTTTQVRRETMCLSLATCARQLHRWSATTMSPTTSSSATLPTTRKM